jgi:Cu/Ag efflux protein CusF
MGKRIALVLLLALAGCRSPEPANELKEEPLRTYELKGQVLKLDASGEVKTATIRHEQIGDWMGPMTMEFPILDEAQFSKLKEGQQVTGKVFVRGLTFWAGEFQDPAPAK